MGAADFVGQPTPPRTVVVERGPVANFAKAVKDTEPADGIAPPTFSFAMTHWGAFPELQPEGHDGPNPMLQALGALMAEAPGLLLHGEQEFTYHRPVKIGDVLTSRGKVADVRTKQSAGGATMTFVVTETEWRDAEDAPVVTEVMTLIHRA